MSARKRDGRSVIALNYLTVSVYTNIKAPLLATSTLLNNCYIELNHYLSVIIIIIIIITIIIIQSYGFIVTLKDHDITSLNHSSSFFSLLFFTLVSSCEYTEHLNRNVRRMDESKETFACSQV